MSALPAGGELLEVPKIQEPVEIDLLMFDCDGVLFDSEAANVAFYNEVLRKGGLPPMDAPTAKRSHELASAQLFAQMFADDPERHAEMRAIAKATDYAPFFSYMTPRDGLAGLLDELGRSRKIAMATNRGLTVDDVLAVFDLTEYFDLAVGVLHVENPKPSPDMLELCLSRFGVAPERAMYVGDQPNDARAAMAAGVHFVGMDPVAGVVPNRVETLHELRDFLAD